MPIKHNITKPRPQFGPELLQLQKSVVKDIANLFPITASKLDNSVELAMPCPVAAIWSRIEKIIMDDALQKKGEDLKREYIVYFRQISQTLLNYLTKSWWKSNSVTK